jgi:ubiquinone/menaquinone biosynthesis C-methylase UbiE
MPTNTLTEHIQRFYNANTGLFLKLGHSSEGSIHRAIWAYGVHNRHEALHYVDDQICRLLLKHYSKHKPHIVDLGCGVASSLCYIKSQMPVTGLGITISEEQCKLGNQRIETQGYSDKLQCLQADFCKLPRDLQQADLAFAIESFVHAQSAAAFFHQASALIKPGGFLIICDDFLADEKFLQDEKAAPWLERFQKGWLISSLCTKQQASKYAEQLGFRQIDHQDLTPFLELNRPRDYLISLLLKFTHKFANKKPYLQMLYGGNALQKCLNRQWLKHEMIVWQKTND